ncbi:unnamed protein product [Ranitomeya imitator]|uniref:Endothelin-3 n=1 Tax=Ranitomeya imitator TaxID=111125 RepID=A0ABN9L0Q4_9NEOB|nr:unnamed protein product [Ranitomeya imitator]
MEQRLLIILGLLVTSNTGFVLALLPQLSGAKGILQVKEGGRKGSRGEKESSTIFLQSGVTLPPGSASPGPQGTPIPGYEQMSPSFHLEPDSGGAHRRERRCTCYTYKDKECVYYCHLDIIWINTPEPIDLHCRLDQYRIHSPEHQITGQTESGRFEERGHKVAVSLRLLEASASTVQSTRSQGRQSPAGLEASPESPYPGIKRSDANSVVSDSQDTFRALVESMPQGVKAVLVPQRSLISRQELSQFKSWGQVFKASSYNVKYGMVPALLNNFGLYCFFYCSLWIIAISMRTQQQDKILEYGQSKTAEDV